MNCDCMIIIIVYLTKDYLSFSLWLLYCAIILVNNIKNEGVYFIVFISEEIMNYL